MTSPGGAETGTDAGNLDGSSILAIVNGWIRTEPVRAKVVCKHQALRQILIDITLNAGVLKRPSKFYFISFRSFLPSFLSSRLLLFTYIRTLLATAIA